MELKKEKTIPKKQFLYLMTRLATAFREDVSKELFDLYYEFLGNVEIGKLKQCVDDLIREKKWFPKIAEFEEFLNPNTNPGSEYMAYLERNTRNRLIEWKEQGKKMSHEDAMICLKKVKEAIDGKPTLDGEQATEFERKRNLAKEKAKKLLN